MIQVINRALDILELLADNPEGHKTLSEISQQLNLNNATCANIIKTMVDRNYIEKLEKKKGYCLGARLYTLTGSEGYKKDLTMAGKEECTWLSKKVNENSLLAVLDKDMRRVLVRIMGSHPIQASTASEKRAYNCSTGRVLLAMLPDGELERHLIQYGLPKNEEWEGVKDEKTFREQIRRIRENGYATQVTKEKIVGLAVPVFKNDKAIAGISVYMPQFRYSKSDKIEIINLMNQTSKRITRRLK